MSGNLLPAFARRGGVDGKGVHAAGEFVRQRRINQRWRSPGHAFEEFRHYIDPEMGLPARPMPGMAFVLVQFIQHFEALRRESLGQLLCDQIGGPHGVRLKDGQAGGQCLRPAGEGRCAVKS